MRRSTFARRSYKGAPIFALAALLGLGPAAGSEWVQETPDFLIRRDFQSFRIPASAAVFFKTDTPSGVDRPDAEIRAETRRLLGGRLSFVDKPVEARYGLSVRLEEYTDYATRNSRGRPATGFAMFAICALPITEVTENCQNLTFYYFGREPRVTMFRRAAEAWLELIIQ